MRIPAAIYPFSAELLPAVKYFERLQDRYTLTKLISLPGCGGRTRRGKPYWSPGTYHRRDFPMKRW